MEMNRLNVQQSGNISSSFRSQDLRSSEQHDGRVWITVSKYNVSAKLLL